jgi:hypothetical protein
MVQTKVETMSQPMATAKVMEIASMMTFNHVGAFTVEQP